jgi:hypothetical protein
MDSLAVIEPLYEIARQTAARQMQREHFIGSPAAA